MTTTRQLRVSTICPPPRPELGQLEFECRAEPIQHLGRLNVITHIPSATADVDRPRMLSRCCPPDCRIAASARAVPARHTQDERTEFLNRIRLNIITGRHSSTIHLPAIPCRYAERTVRAHRGRPPLRHEDDNDDDGRHCGDGSRRAWARCSTTHTVAVRAGPDVRSP